MKSGHHQQKWERNLMNYKEVLEDTYNSMSLDQIKKTKPKSRLESFLRRKALEGR